MPPSQIDRRPPLPPGGMNRLFSVYHIFPRMQAAFPPGCQFQRFYQPLPRSAEQMRGNGGISSKFRTYVIEWGPNHSGVRRSMGGLA